ncbi:hypothetical protein BDN72DRAFT_837448 [Pluteus cervinus]|uniref:Uncharacterized protein n=1 Tax=Pluteus cervinus TaxID=181527 RepID=A0ACD3B147_9AGAR|nr:hypothetical protein BDN72DRAFT_837448 [Pluteus cervinus]
MNFIPPTSSHFNSFAGNAAFHSAFWDARPSYVQTGATALKSVPSEYPMDVDNSLEGASQNVWGGHLTDIPDKGDTYSLSMVWQNAPGAGPWFAVYAGPPAPRRLGKPTTEEFLDHIQALYFKVATPIYFILEDPDTEEGYVDFGAKAKYNKDLAYRALLRCLYRCLQSGTLRRPITLTIYLPDDFVCTTHHLLSDLNFSCVSAFHWKGARENLPANLEQLKFSEAITTVSFKTKLSLADCYEVIKQGYRSLGSASFEEIYSVGPLDLGAQVHIPYLKNLWLKTRISPLPLLHVLQWPQLLRGEKEIEHALHLKILKEAYSPSDPKRILEETTGRCHLYLSGGWCTENTEYDPYQKPHELTIHYSYDNYALPTR